MTWREAPGAYAGGLVIAAWIAPVVAGVVTMAVYLAPAVFGTMNAVLTGVIGGGVVWLVVAGAVAPIVSARERSNPESWEDADSRITGLEAQVRRLRATQPDADVAEAQCDLAAIETHPFGFKWATKHGYLGLWQRIHRAEEALLESTALADLWGVVENASLRLAMAVGISPSLAPALTDVIRYMADPKGAPPQEHLAPAMPPVASDGDARKRLREIVNAINTFRDSAWSGLVRLRSQLLVQLVLTEVFAYGLLAFVVALPVGRDQVIAGVTYFLVAAVTGLGAQLLIMRTTTSQAVDDYGLSLARLLLIPIAAGLAGVGGVILTAELLNAPFTSLVQATSAARGAGPLPSLMDVFDLHENRGGIVFAILFGYAPNLLVSRLDNLVANYKNAISSTESGTTGSSG